MAGKTKTTKETGTCLVTGEPTRSKRTKFRPGMDARLKGLCIKVVRDGASYNSLPAAARKIWDAGETLVGFKIRNGKLTKVGEFEIAAKGRASKGAKKAAPKAKAKAKSAAKRSGKIGGRKPVAADPAAVPAVVESAAE